MTTPASIILLALFLSALPGPSETLAWWRFEGGADGTDVTHAAAAGAFSADILDSSGNGNSLSVWETGGGGGFKYRSDVALSPLPRTGDANGRSVQNTGGGPNMFTSPTSPFRTVTPAAWTIEVIFKPENGGHRTFVGRDSRGSGDDPRLSTLYLQAQPDNALALLYIDAAGYFHEAISVPGLVKGFDWPTDMQGATGQWQAAVAVSDGSSLRLYYRNLTAGDLDFLLVAEVDLVASGSPDTSLGAGAGTGSNWTAGSWTVGRGLWDGGHTDRAYGFIDEVRISDEALEPARFLLASGDFSLVSFTVDGGGGRSTGSSFSLTGTIGQPDASSSLVSGSYSLNGGFWKLPPSGFPAWAAMNIAPGRDMSFEGSALDNGVPNGLRYIFGNLPITPQSGTATDTGRIPAPPFVPADVVLRLELSGPGLENVNEVLVDWITLVTWEGNLPPVFAYPAFTSIQNGIIIDEGNFSPFFYRYKAELRP